MIADIVALDGAGAVVLGFVLVGTSNNGLNVAAATSC